MYQDTQNSQKYFRTKIANATHAAIVETIIAMARHMKIQTVAEGVETKEQLAVLPKHGYQGFLYGKPMSADEFVILCRMQKTGKLTRILAPRQGRAKQHVLPATHLPPAQSRQL